MFDIDNFDSITICTSKLTFIAQHWKKPSGMEIEETPLGKKVTTEKISSALPPLDLCCAKHESQVMLSRKFFGGFVRQINMRGGGGRLLFRGLHFRHMGSCFNYELFVVLPPLPLDIKLATGVLIYVVDLTLTSQFNVCVTSMGSLTTSIFILQNHSPILIHRKVRSTQMKNFPFSFKKQIMLWFC